MNWRHFDMGMFDTTTLHCPKCGTGNQIQSKGGDCVLAEYERFEQTPIDVLAGLLEANKVITCTHCDTPYRVKAQFNVTATNIVSELITWIEETDSRLANKLAPTVIDDAYTFVQTYSLFSIPLMASIDGNITLIWKLADSDKLSVTFTGNQQYNVQLVVNNELLDDTLNIDQTLPSYVMIQLPWINHFSIRDNDVVSHIGTAFANNRIASVNFHHTHVVLKDLADKLSEIYSVWDEKYISSHLYFINAASME
jgi:hypothetical protein